MYSAALLPTWTKFSSSLVLSANDRSPESVTASAMFSASTETVSVGRTNIHRDVDVALFAAAQRDIRWQ